MIDKTMIEPEIHNSKLSQFGQFTCEYAHIQYKRNIDGKWFKKITNSWLFVRNECVPEIVIASYKDSVKQKERNT